MESNSQFNSQTTVVKSGHDLEFHGVRKIVNGVSGVLRFDNKISHWYVTFLTLVPLTVLAIDVSCTKGTCSIYEIPPFPTQLSDYINLESIQLYVCWLAYQAVMFVIPIGPLLQRKSADGKMSNYRLNGVSTLAITCTLISLSVYLGFKSYITKIMDNFISLHVLSVVTGLAFATHAYKCGTQSPTAAGFITGSHCNPTVHGWDLKRFLIRTSLMTWVVIGFAHQTSMASKLHQQNSPLTLLTIFHVFVVAEALWFEGNWESFTVINHDRVGFGFIYACLTALPVLATSTIRFLSINGGQFTELSLIMRFFSMVPGYCLYRGSISDKTSFEQQPNHPNFDDYYIIRSGDGDGILADGFWSHCRNPTYLGIIMLTYSLTTYGFDNIYHYACFVTVLLYLISRSIANDRINEVVYGKHMWSAYCHRVRARIFKLIF